MSQSLQQPHQRGPNHIAEERKSGVFFLRIGAAVCWCDSAPSQGVPLGRPTRRQAVVGLRYVSPQPAVNVMAEMWRPAC